MQVDLIHTTYTAIAKVGLESREELFAQHGSLIAMNDNIKVQTLMRRSSEGSSGNGKSTSKMTGSHVLCLNNYEAESDGGEIYLAPALTGNIICYQLTQSKLIIRQSAYLASGGNIEIFMGYRSPVKHDRTTWLSLVGDGNVLMSSLGGIYNVDIDGTHLINCDHIIAFENTLKVKLFSKLKSWQKMLMPRQEIFYEFTGKGRLFFQTHRPAALAQKIGQQLKSRKKSF